MNKPNRMHCRHCSGGTMEEVAYSEVVRVGRTNVEVSGLLKSVCKNCGTDVVSAAQFEHNDELYSAAEKKVPGYMPVRVLKDFREKYGLSQKDAGRLIGTGESAFGKYEAGSRPSAPAAKLIRAALAFPEVAKMLAEEERIELDVPSRANTWHELVVPDMA